MRCAIPPHDARRSGFSKLVQVAGSVLTLAAAAQGQDWCTLAGGADRVSVGQNPPDLLGPPRWIASVDDVGQPIVFEGQASVLTRFDRVFALGRSGGQSRLFCLHAASGQVLWGAPVPAPVLQSWASPSLDGAHGTVLIAAARYVTAIDADSGAQAWQTQVDRNLAGATPAITTDLPGRNRAFVTDYDGLGVAGKLYCLNVDPYGPGNPYQPGQIVWTAPLGTTAANTPAYAAGVVYVSSVSDETGFSSGIIRAYSATQTGNPTPIWTFINSTPIGFYGGVCVKGPWVYAASYAFYGGQFAANLVKLDASSGVLQWSVPCNRTDAIPVPLADGTVIVSGGIRGYGSFPSVQRFRDDGASAALLWDSTFDTWQDLNGNSQIDPGEYVDVGGWTVQPVACDKGGGNSLYVGAFPTGVTTVAACTALKCLDLNVSPTDPNFVRESFGGAGSNPAVGYSGLYTLGPTGLYAFGRAPCFANCDGTTEPPVLNANDFQCFLNRFAAGDTWANCDQSTMPPVLNANDFQCMLNAFAAGCP